MFNNAYMLADARYVRGGFEILIVHSFPTRKH